MQIRFADLSGRVFNKLTVIKFNGRNSTNEIMWLCKCVCGKEKSIRGTCLTSGRSASCGCSRVLNTHGLSKTAEYRTWSAMKTRCNNKNSSRFPDWGGKGIKVCKRWNNSFENFLSDMGNKPTPEHTLDRYPDNKGDYKPSNCRWATLQQQANNKENSVVITYKGKTQTVPEWSKETGISADSLYYRFREKFPIELVFSKGNLKSKENQQWIKS